MKFMYFILLCIVLVLAYKFNIWIGLIVSVLVVIYLIYKYLPELYRAKGRQSFQNGNYADAKTMYEKAMSIRHANGNVRMEYSYILLRTGNIEEAEQVVNNMLCYKLNPQFRGKAIIQRCMCYYKRGNIDEALSDAMDLYNEGFRSIMLYEMIGFFKILVDPMSQETFDFCSEAYEYADDDRDICDNMLICWYNRGEYKKAKDISDSVIEKNPKFVEAWYHAAQIDDKLCDYKSALEKLSHTGNCNRSFMTTIPEADIDKLKTEIEKKIKVEE